MALYEINTQIRQLLDQVDEETGELTPDTIEQIDRLNLTRTTKIDHIIARRQELIREAEAYKAESDRLNALRKAAETHAESYKNYVFGIMVSLGEERLETERFKLRIQNNSRPSFRWDGDLDAMPIEWRKPIPIELNGTRAYDEWRKSPDNLPAEITATIGKHLRVR